MTEQLAEYERFMGQASRYIKTLEAVLQWIPVDEQLPPLDQRVLGLLNDEAVFAIRDEEGFWDEWGVVELEGEEAISHWLPIPPSPGWEKSND